MNKRWILVFLVTVILTVGKASATDTGYHTVNWMQVEASGNIAFRLNEDVEAYYRCEGGTRTACQAMLLTAIATGREVKVFYDSSAKGGHEPRPGSTQTVTTLRLR